MLSQLACVLRENESRLYEAIAGDFNKSEFETYGTELGPLYRDIRGAIKHVHKWAARKRVRTNLLNFPGRSYIIPEPLGVSLVIGAWNYPYHLSLAPVVAAIAAGNTVILKPSELPSATSHVMAEIMNAGFDSELFTVIEGGVSEATELLSLAYDKIFFTGSVPVGRIVYQAAAKHLTPVTLELGGKSPTIVAKDCNIQRTAQRIVWGKFLNAGQTCIAPDYVLVDASIRNELLQAMRTFIEKFGYSEKNGNYVSIIDDRNFDRLSALIDDSKVFCGGRREAATRRIEPTILRDVSFDDPVMRDEIFGPILPVIDFTDIGAMVREVVSRPKPLACYIFTRDRALRDRLLRGISFGGGAINDTIMHVSNDRLPFGGVGQSGMGSYHGEAGFRAFSHYKSVLDKPTWFEPDIKYPPYSAWKYKWVKRLLR